MSSCYKYYKRDSESSVTWALAHQILQEPVVTEKALKIGSNGYISFVVGKQFNKMQIKKAFLLIYKDLITEVLKVNVVNCKGKAKRDAKRREYSRSDYKKAMVLVRVAGDSESLMNSVYGGEK